VAADPGSPAAEAQYPCPDLAACIDFFVNRLGFRIATIFPADAPTAASLVGHGLRIRLIHGGAAQGHIRLPCAKLPGPADRMVVAPNGLVVEWFLADPPIEIPEGRADFLVTHSADGPRPAPGRAGMIYRDLIPGRQGGRFIASHIQIPDGGPVEDWVHFHKIRFQMIFCRRGWVRVVYEDQGPPMTMHAGDCFLQPPGIRHRVLEASPGLEVVEISCPAAHETLADLELVLPTGRVSPERVFGDQVFLHHVAAAAPWRPFETGAFEARDTGMTAATRGMADARVLRPGVTNAAGFAPHGHEILFGFVLEGSVSLECQGRRALGPTDAFVIPPGVAWGLNDGFADLRILLVTVG